jgi:hypothetical protein
VSTPEPYVSQVDIVALTWEQFRAINDVYRRWVTDVWMHTESQTYGVRLTNVPLLSASALHDTIVSAEAPAFVGTPTDGRPDEHDG